MEKVDDFFKKKVESLAAEPRPEAWTKLEANLSKKNKGLTWLRVAAAFLLAGLFLTSILWWQEKAESVRVATKSIPEKSAPPTQALKEDERSNTPPAAKSVARLHRKKESVAPKGEPQAKEKRAAEPGIIQTETAESTSTPTVAAITVEQPIVIEYRLESVNYLKKETPAVATAGDKKNSLQKAIDFAREAKNSDSPLGGLRQAKDDLFAGNFKKDKQKKQ